MKRCRTSLYTVSGYVRELEKGLKKNNEFLINKVPQDIFNLCLSYFSVTKDHCEASDEYVAIKASDPKESRNQALIKYKFPDVGIRIDEININALTSDQNWGNTGHCYFSLSINGDTSFHLFHINHNQHPGFYNYSVKYTYDDNLDKLGDIIGGDELIVSCHCAPYPGPKSDSNRQIQLTRF